MTNEMDFALYLVIKAFFKLLALELIWQPETSYWQDAIIQYGHWSWRPLVVLIYAVFWC